MKLPRVALVLLGSVVGCTLFVDTSGFVNEAHEPSAGAGLDGGSSYVDASTDAPASDDEAGTPPDPVEIPGLVAHWAFDEGGGAAVTDASGNGHDGIVIGGRWVEDRHGASGRALLLEGKSGPGEGDHVSVAAAPDFDRPEDPALTISAWIRFDAPPGHDVLFSVDCEEPRETGYDLEFLDGELTYWDGFDHVAGAQVPNVVGVWRHVGVVVEGAKARTYFDGLRVGEATANTTPCLAKQIYMGMDSENRTYTKVAIDDVRFYRVALDDAQMVVEKNR